VSIGSFVCGGQGKISMYVKAYAHAVKRLQLKRVKQLKCDKLCQTNERKNAGFRALEYKTHSVLIGLVQKIKNSEDKNPLMYQEGMYKSYHWEKKRAI